MTESFRCGDEPGLIAFLYDECSPQEREAVAAHVAGCPRCAVALGGLAGAREQLAVWAPPEAPLGFRITRDDLDTVVKWEPDFPEVVAAVAGGGGVPGR